MLCHLIEGLWCYSFHKFCLAQDIGYLPMLLTSPNQKSKNIRNILLILGCYYNLNNILGGTFELIWEPSDHRAPLSKSEHQRMLSSWLTVPHFHILFAALAFVAITDFVIKKGGYYYAISSPSMTQSQ